MFSLVLFWNSVAPTGEDQTFHLTLILFSHEDDSYFTVWRRHIDSSNFVCSGLLSEFMAFHLKGPVCSDQTGHPGTAACFKTLSFSWQWQLLQKGERAVITVGWQARGNWKLVETSLGRLQSPETKVLALAIWKWKLYCAHLVSPSDVLEKWQLYRRALLKIKY